MDAADLELRNATYARFIALGRAPSAAEMGAYAGMPPDALRDAWRRLHGDILMANPFSAVRTPFRVDAAGRSWFANCAWDAFGIGSALHVDSTIHTACADCHEPLDIQVRDGLPADRSLVFHVLVPASSWWNDIGFT
ncbi:MAG: hypothetical protein HW391_2073 [Chloroflexi bacterium]|nr:hypothetical protein [Chloroflexota bacterium]